MGADLTSEERRKIYLEEKARPEARDRVAAEKKKKERTQGCLGCLGLVILIVVGAKFCPGEPEDPIKKARGVEEKSKTQEQRKVPPPRRGGSFESETTDPSKKKPEFAFTVEEFIDRYNHAWQNLRKDTRVSKWKEIRSGNEVGVQLSLNENIMIGLTANNVTRRVTDMMLMAQSDGTLRSGAEIILAMLALVMAIENPSTPVSQRGEILRDLGVPGEVAEAGDQKKIVRRGVSYFVGRSKLVGTFLTANPSPTD